MDFRTPASIIQRKNGSDLLDLRYDSHYITDGKPEIEGLPQTYVMDKSEAQTLVISLRIEKQRFISICSIPYLLIEQ